jgi:hypothetical protein
MCLTDEIEGWLTRKKLSLVHGFKREVRTLLASIKLQPNAKCSVCFSETRQHVCPTCFTRKIQAWLASQDKKLAGEFSRAFSPETLTSKIFDRETEREVFA